MKEETLQLLRGKADASATEKKRIRDDLNGKQREHIQTRNSFNKQVRELISEVQHQKGIRDEANGTVREAKSDRAEKNQEVRTAKDRVRELDPKTEQRGGERDRRGRRDKEDTPASLRRKIEALDREFELGKHTGSNVKKAMHTMKALKRKLRDLAEKEDSNVELKEARKTLAEAIDAQEASHQIVEEAAKIAQDAHDLMLSLSEKVDVLRLKADDCQKQVRSAKREADRAHQSYIVSIRCLHSLNDILRVSRNASLENEMTEDEALEDLEPLSEEEIQTATEIIMDYYENSNQNLHERARKHSDFVDSIEYKLEPGVHKMVISSPMVGILIGRKGAISKPLQEKLLEHFPHILVDFQSIKKTQGDSTKSNPHTMGSSSSAVETAILEPNQTKKTGGMPTLPHLPPRISSPLPPPPPPPSFDTASEEEEEKEEEEE